MTTKDLPRSAETLRTLIKSMIPEARGSEETDTTATVLNEDHEGNKEYVGDLLGQRVSALVQQLPIGAVGGSSLLFT